MSSTLIGIENVHEFYTEHYLAAVLASDLAPALARWRAASASASASAAPTDDTAPDTDDTAPDTDDTALDDTDDAPDAESDAATVTPWGALRRLHGDYFAYRERLRQTRAPAARVALHRDWWARALHALGYEQRAAAVPLGPRPTDPALPLYAAVARADAAPLVWLVPAPAELDADADLLEQPLLPALATVTSEVPGLREALVALGASGLPRALPPPSATIEDLVTAAFALEEPPRFVLVLGEGELVLADRGKWPEQRLLRFDLDELLGRREPGTLQTVVALLHRDALAPAAGPPLVDTFDDSSHKHAYAVSEDLKHALRAAIEAIGNEAIRYRREVSRKRVFGEEIDAQQLALECLRFMYRLLFLFYVEARPELGYAPMGADAYRKGYSLERLRELDRLDDLQTEEAREGFYIDDCLRRLFRMVYEGSHGTGQQSLHHTFHLDPLRSHLFDPERTPFLAKVRLRNRVLLPVLRQMSLSRPKKGARKGRDRVGRISYATLGINQLGAAYEALLSFRGFFAEETLYEVKPAGDDDHDELGVAFFVTEAQLRDYGEAEWVLDGDRVRSYPPGTFIYRQAGRDRQKSASYYTPEVLTRCLVEYALRELLDDEHGRPRRSATELLALTICEPAMGSAAFLNEAIDQLAERYLAQRQQELGERIPQARYRDELQRVKMHIADNNVFGVDKNPVALELAEVSLWLNAIFGARANTPDASDAAAPPADRGLFVPWFGAQLCCGNSLVGAWHKVFTAPELDAYADGAGAEVAGTGGYEKRASSAPWLDAVPARVPLTPGAARPEGSVYHFLLGDRGMAAYAQGSEGKPIKALCADALATIARWRRDFCAPLPSDERDTLVRLSDAVDRLWRAHAEQLREVRLRTTDPLDLYGFAHPLGRRAPTTTEYKDRVWAGELESERVRASSPYRRLKLVMDYWYALWFWPLDLADELPDRDEYLEELALILDTEMAPSAQLGQTELFAATQSGDQRRALLAAAGFVDLEKVVAAYPRLRLVRELAARYRFHHWELEFADQFVERGGFDLVLGNPPWIAVTWTEAGVLGDRDPSFILKKLSARQVADRRDAALADAATRAAYLAEHEEAAGTQAVLSALQCYPDLQGVKSNTYKCFVPLAWDLGNERGVAGLLHPESLYDDPKGGRARRALYPRLRRHYQFANEKKLFAEVDNHTNYSANVYGPPGEVAFTTIANLFVPSTIGESEAHAGHGPVPGIKDEDDNWAVAGHRDRLVRVAPDELALFARLYDEPDTPALEARLPAIHATSLLGVLERLAEAETLGGAGWEYFPTFHWNETYAQHAGTIRRETRFPEGAAELVLSGPHFFVGNPLYKTPRAECTSNKAYDVIDLTEVPDDYLPRTNYVRACSEAEYLARTPKVPWGTEELPIRVTEGYRVVANRGLSTAGERTLQPVIAPRELAHIGAARGPAHGRRGPARPRRGRARSATRRRSCPWRGGAAAGAGRGPPFRRGTPIRRGRPRWARGSRRPRRRA